MPYVKESTRCISNHIKPKKFAGQKENKNFAEIYPGRR